MTYTEPTVEQIDEILQKAWKAFHVYRKLPLGSRAEFMRAIDKEMEALGDEVLKVAHEETNLPDLRLRRERTRTIFQLNSYAEIAQGGQLLDARIDTGLP